MITKKLKAGALQLTTFIVVIIALLLAAFIALVHTHNMFKAQTSFLKETIDYSNKGIHYVLNNQINSNDTTLVHLQGEDDKSLKVHRNFWGVYEKVVSVSKIKNKTFKKIALVGGIQPELGRTALYIEDNNRPLVLVGHTRIEGTAFLPRQGVRTGNISGHSYYGNQLIYGKEKTSNKLPKLHNDIIKNIEAINETYKFLDSNQFLDLEMGQRYQNSFYKPLQVAFSPNTINLSGISLTGHIIVQSKTKIIVNATSNLKDVILIAPKVELKNNVKGVFQIFARKEILIGSNCELDYPSSVILKEKRQIGYSSNSNAEPPKIMIKKQSDIKGNLIYLGTSKSYKAQVFIGEKTNFTGEIYCNKNMELLGAIKGTVFTSGFSANQSGSVYQNHIYNGVINVNNLPNEYIGLKFEKTKKGIAKWLY